MRVSFTIASTALTLLPLLAGCNDTTNPPRSEPQAEASACVDSNADNYTFEGLIEVGIMPKEPGWRDVADPILTKVPPGGYAKLVQAVCGVVPPQDAEMMDWRKMPGKFAMQGVMACIEASGAPNGATVQFFLNRTASLYEIEGDKNTENDYQHKTYLDTYWPAIAEHYCPQLFRK